MPPKKTLNSPYACILAGGSSTQSYTSGSWAALGLGIELFDPWTWHSQVTNTSRVTPSVAGLFRCYFHMAFAVGNTNDDAAQIRRNGAVIDPTSGDGLQPYNIASTPKSSGNYGIVETWAWIRCNGSTDYVEPWALQNQGTAKSSAYGGATDGQCPLFAVEWWAP